MCDSRVSSASKLCVFAVCFQREMAAEQAQETLHTCRVRHRSQFQIIKQDRTRAACVYTHNKAQRPLQKAHVEPCSQTRDCAPRGDQTMPPCRFPGPASRPPPSAPLWDPTSGALPAALRLDELPLLSAPGGGGTRFRGRSVHVFSSAGGIATPPAHRPKTSSRPLFTPLARFKRHTEPTRMRLNGNAMAHNESARRIIDENSQLLARKTGDVHRFSQSLFQDNPGGPNLAEIAPELREFGPKLAEIGPELVDSGPVLSKLAGVGPSWPIRG